MQRCPKAATSRTRKSIARPPALPVQAVPEGAFLSSLKGFPLLLCRVVELVGRGPREA